MPTRPTASGAAAEALIEARLVASGWAVLGRNVHVGRAELDLVAVDPGPPARLVVVEVRFRSRRDYGTAEESVDARKRARLRLALATLRERGSLPDGTPVPAFGARFDLVAVEPGLPRPDGTPSSPRIRHHVAAF